MADPACVRKMMRGEGMNFKEALAECNKSGGGSSTSSSSDKKAMKK